MSTRHRVKYEDSSHALTTDLAVGIGTPTAATVTAKDRAGNVLLNGTIDSVADAGGGTCTFSYTGHAVAVGDVVTIAGTTSYNDEQTVTAIGAGTFTATETYVADESGTYTITAAKATVLTATTLGAAATKGAGSITLAAVTSLVEGYPLRIAMSADGGKEDVVISAVNTSSKVCQLEDYLKEDHTNAAAVTGRRLSYTLDASQSDFTSGLDFLVIWDVTNVDDPAWREDAEILKRSVSVGGLEEEFRVLHGHYFMEIPDGKFGVYKDAAYSQLRTEINWNDKQDIDKLVNPDGLEYLLTTRIMRNIAFSQGDAWESERTASTILYNDALKKFLEARKWVDANQDDIETDSEVQPMLRKPPRRRLT